MIFFAMCSVCWSQGMTLLMMGSAEALPEEPAVRPMFVEDMTEEQLASAVSQTGPPWGVDLLAGHGLVGMGSVVFER